MDRIHDVLKLTWLIILIGKLFQNAFWAVVVGLSHLFLLKHNVLVPLRCLRNDQEGQ